MNKEFKVKKGFLRMNVGASFGFVLFFQFFGVLSVFGQGEILMDPKVRTGHLSNGFTYYIRKNAEPMGRAELYLVNKVGSILEKERERGLAHFLEHMAFNGTKHFPKNELVNYLQKSGVRFGADLNAYTSFDETVYQLPIPTDNPELFTNALQIMRDWAGDLLLDSVEIEKERGVILEEKRLRQGVQQRIFEKSLPFFSNGSLYGERLPIGTEDVLKKFNRAEIVKFYKTWYRPSLQAIIVVGDVDVDRVESEIKSKFGSLKNPDVEQPRERITIPLNGGNRFLAIFDTEIPNGSVTVSIKHSGDIATDRRSYIRNFLESVYSQMLSVRINELNHNTAAPYRSAQAGYGDFLGGLRATTITIGLKDDSVESGVKAVWKEISRLKKHGFVSSELERAKKTILSSLDRQLNEKDKRGSSSYVSEYQRHFLLGEVSPGIESESSLIRSILDSLSLSSINSLSQKILKSTDRDILVTLPEPYRGVSITEEELGKWLLSAENSVETGYSDGDELGKLMSKEVDGGRISSRRELSGIGVTELILSNGVKVYLKPTDFQNDAVQFSSFSPGGTSLYDDVDFESANSAVNIALRSGVSSYDALALSKLLTGKQVRVSPYIGEYYEGINGASNKKDLKESLELLYLYFTAPRFDRGMFAKLIEDSESSIKNRYKDPEKVFGDTVSSVMGGYHFRRQAPSMDRLGRIDFSRSGSIFKERFSDASDFTFVFTGNFDIDSISPLLAKYLGGLPGHGRKERYRDLGIRPLKGSFRKTVSSGKEDKATVVLVYEGYYKGGEKEDMALVALEQVLGFRLIERLREKEGGVYTPSVSVSFGKVPRGEYNVVINFGCSPANVDFLIKATLEEIEGLQKKGATSDDMLKFRTEEMRQHELKLRNNQFWLGYLSGTLRTGGDLLSVLRTKDVLNSLTPSDVKNGAKKYLKKENLKQFINLPDGK